MLARYLISATEIVLGIIEFVLGFRLLLKFFSASQNTPFVRWVYETSEPLLSPFSGIFPTSTLTGGFQIEFTSLFALIVYGFIGYLISSSVLAISETSVKRKK